MGWLGEEWWFDNLGRLLGLDLRMVRGELLRGTLLIIEK